MAQWLKWMGLLGLAAAACSHELPADDVGLATQALGPCNETVPANRNVDGIPAYAQCTTTESSAIYSNNGVDTSVTQMGSDWVRTQWSGGYQCTELAHRYLHFRWKVKWIPNGNAGNWCDTQPPASSGVVQTMTPVHGDIMVLAPGSCGAAQSTGHVNVVDTVDMATGKLTAVEQNRAGRNMYNMSCAKCFLHVMANDGKPMPIATPAIAGAPAPGGTTGAPAPGAAAGAPAVPAPAADGGAGRAPRPGGAAPPARPAGPAAAGAPAPSLPSQPTAAAPTAPVVSGVAGGSAGSRVLDFEGAGRGGQSSSAPAATDAGSRRTTPAAQGCSTSGVDRHGARPSLVSAGLWLMVLAAWSFRRRGRRAFDAQAG